MKRFIDSVSVDRRLVLKVVGTAGAIGLCGAEAASAFLTPSVSMLDSREVQTLRTLLSRLLPADAAMGGALEAGADNYIQLALANSYSAHLPLYRAGLAAVSVLAKRLATELGRPLVPQDFDRILVRLEQGTVDQPLNYANGHLIPLSNGGGDFFRLLRTHMLEGTFGDPAYGGNKNFLGWRLVRYPGVQLFYSADEQAIDGQSAQQNRSLTDLGGHAKL